MQLVCPHCHNPMEQPQNGALQEIVCPTCGSSFRLEGERTRTYAEKNRQLGKFELLDRVGVGAFGVVWRARDTDLNRLVAIKIPHAGRFVTPQDDARFLREGRSAAQLRHPGIVSVHEVGRHEGLPFLVADFIHGVTLADFLTSRRPSIREAVELMAQVAEALDYAHSMGVVHRDIKPSNIMLERPPFPEASRAASAGELGGVSRRTDLGPATLGKPMLMDFGLALRDEVEVTMTLDGQILGTPAYMSPEQAAGFSHQLDARSDVYSLGVVFYQLLTGELPFRGNSRMQMEQVLREEPRPPRRLNDKIPRDLDTICMKAMAKEPGRRYATARDLADDLRRFLRGEPIKARPIGALERVWNWARRKPAAAGLLLVSAVAALALVAVAVGLWYTAELQNARRAEEQQRQVTEAALDREKSLLYANRVVLAEREWQANNIRRAEELLEESPLSLRGWEWHYLKRLCHLELRTLRGHKDQAGSVAYSPDGNMIASAGWDNTLRIWDASKGEEIRFLQLRGWALCVAFSPDGKLIASGNGAYIKPNDVWIWSAASGERLLTLSGHSGPIYGVAFSPKNQLLASGSADGTIRIWELEKGRPVHVFQEQEKQGGITRIAFTPDGQQLISASGAVDAFASQKIPAVVKVWDIQTGRVLHTLWGHQALVRSVACSRDGKYLASASQDGTVRLWDRKTNEGLKIFRGHTQVVTGVAFSPDGLRLASSSEDGSLKLWDLVSGMEDFTLRANAGQVNDLAFSPDGRYLASACEDHTVRIWDARISRESATLPGVKDSVSSVTFSPNSRWIASGCRDGSVGIWDAATGALVRKLHGQGPVWNVAISPNGEQIGASTGDYARPDLSGQVKIWHLASGKELRTFAGDTNIFWCLAFSPDGQRIAAAGGELRDGPGCLRVWDVDTGKRIVSVDGLPYGIKALAFSPDGQLLATSAGDATAKIWNPSSGQLLFKLADNNASALGLAFSPDGRRLAAGCDDGTVTLWDVLAREKVGAFPGHTNNVTSVAFSPDGLRLASASMDRTVKIWDVTARQEVLTLRGHSGRVWSATFSPDGKRIASSSQDGTIKIWDSRILEDAQNSGANRNP